MPRPVSEVREVATAEVVTGKFLPWRILTRQPVLIDIDGETFLPIYSTVEALKKSIDSLAGLPEDYSIKKIDDGCQLLLGLIGTSVRVALDPRNVNNKVRFTLIIPKIN
jgi:hypothetical protein